MANFVSVPAEDKLKKRNLFIVARMFGFSWIIFHFTIVYFFGLILDSILLVGIFLGVGNLMALFLDIPIGVIQKYFKPRKLLIFGNILMIVTTLIFFKFIFFSSLGSLVPSFVESTINNGTISKIAVFFDGGLNWLLILITAIFYGIIKETFDITFLSYVLGSSTPSNYAENLSKYNIAFGLGALAGIVLSGIILGLAIEFAIVVVLVIVLIFLYLIINFFDVGDSTINFGNIKDLDVTSVKGGIGKGKSYMIENIRKVDFKQVIKTTKYIFLIPMEIKKELDMDEIRETTKKNFVSLYHVILGVPKNMVIIWSMTIMLFFGFWDTFVSTFQVEFLSKIIRLNGANPLISNTGGFVTGYVLLGLLVIPIFLSQQFFIDKSKTKGVFAVMSFGVGLSAFSIFFFGISENILFIMFFGLLNSFGYAAAVPLAMATFSERYNTEYAKKYDLKEIDSNSSAAPMKILINLANVVGLVSGGFLVSVLGFDGFFIFLGTCLLVLLILSLLNKKNIMKDE